MPFHCTRTNTTSSCDLHHAFSLHTHKRHLILQPTSRLSTAHAQTPPQCATYIMPFHCTCTNDTSVPDLHMRTQSRPEAGRAATNWNLRWFSLGKHVVSRVGQNRIYTPYMTVYLVISLPRLLYIHRIFMVLANPSRIPTDRHGFTTHAHTRTLIHTCTHTHINIHTCTHKHTVSLW